MLSEGAEEQMKKGLSRNPSESEEQVNRRESGKEAFQFTFVVLNGKDLSLFTDEEKRPVEETASSGFISISPSR